MLANSRVITSIANFLKRLSQQPARGRVSQ